MGIPLLAPAHWLAEVCTTRWAKAAVHNTLTRGQAKARISRLAGLAVEETVVSALAEDVARLAFDLRLTVYDTLYLALAARRGVVAVTADRKMLDAAKRDKAASRLVPGVASPGWGPLGGVPWVGDLPAALRGW